MTDSSQRLRSQAASLTVIANWLVESLPRLPGSVRAHTLNFPELWLAPLYTFGSGLSLVLAALPSHVRAALTDKQRDAISHTEFVVRQIATLEFVRDLSRKSDEEIAKVLNDSETH